MFLYIMSYYVLCILLTVNVIINSIDCNINYYFYKLLLNLVGSCNYFFVQIVMDNFKIESLDLG